MSPQLHSCSLCGYIIGDHDGPDSPWTVLFRIRECNVIHLTPELIEASLFN